MRFHDEARVLSDVLLSDSVPVRVVSAFEDADVLEAQRQAVLGSLVVVFVDPRAWSAVGQVLGAEVVSRSSGDAAHPHVSGHELAVGAGASSGCVLALRRCGGFTAVPGGRVEALWPDGSAAAVSVGRGRGVLTVVLGMLCRGYAEVAARWVRSVHRLPSVDVQLGSVVRAEPVRVVSMGGWVPPVSEASGVNDPDLMRDASYAMRSLPAEVFEALVDLADGRSDACAVLVRACPVGSVPETPEAPHLARKDDLVSELTLLTVARVLGQPVGYAPEHGGDLVQNVCPVRAHADRQTSTSSATVLELHTEAAFHPLRPRFLALLCLRGDPDSATTLTRVEDLVEALSERERYVLRQPRFTTGVDESYTDGRGSARSAPGAVLAGHPDHPRLWLDNDLMLGLDDEAQEALESAAAWARELAAGVTLEEGDLLVVDNDRAVHGRTPFAPRFDGTDRWLQRTLVVGDHRAAGADLDGRIVTTEFNS